MPARRWRGQEGALSSAQVPAHRTRDSINYIWVHTSQSESADMSDKRVLRRACGELVSQNDICSKKRMRGWVSMRGAHSSSGQLYRQHVRICTV